MIEKKCELCGKPFMTYPSIHRRFCSRKCATTKNWENRERADMVKLVCRYCHKEFELPASETRVKEGKVHYCSMECRDNARRSGKNVKCLQCGKDFYSTRIKFCSRECACEYKKAHYQHKEYMENGYVVRYQNGYNKKGNVKVHRAVMEAHIGRRLSEDEIVHHIDGDKTNNSIDNLVIMSRSEHSSLHRRQELKEGKKLFQSIEEV